MHKPLTLLSTPSPQSHLFPQYGLGLTCSYNRIKMVPRRQFSRYLTLANSVGDSTPTSTVADSQSPLILQMD